jgi:hypothetical protein
MGGSGTAADVRRRAELRRMKVLATSLLAFAALVYVVTLHRNGWLGFVNTAAEAAMVGAIADWFAVTALFRHPLGIPIPHTAIIPTRKDTLGKNLEEFVGDNFLAEDVVRDRMRRAQVTRRIGQWLTQPQHATRAAGELAGLGRGALRLTRDEQVLALLDEVVLSRLVERPWGPPAGRLLHRVVADGAHHKLVDVVVAQTHQWLATRTSSCAWCSSVPRPGHRSGSTTGSPTAPTARPSGSSPMSPPTPTTGPGVPSTTSSPASPTTCSTTPPPWPGPRPSSISSWLTPTCGVRSDSSGRPCGGCSKRPSTTRPATCGCAWSTP